MRFFVVENFRGKKKKKEPKKKDSEKKLKIPKRKTSMSLPIQKSSLAPPVSASLHKRKRQGMVFRNKPSSLFNFMRSMSR